MKIYLRRASGFYSIVEAHVGGVYFRHSLEDASARNLIENLLKDLSNKDPDPEYANA